MMPTYEEVRQYQLLRAKFLSAVYDAEPHQHQRLGLSEVSDILESIGAVNLPEGQTTRLVRDLEQAGLIEGLGQSMGDLYAPEVRLTSPGRYEVERWIMTDQPTEHLPLKASVVINDNSVNISGGNVQGSAFAPGATHTSITINNSLSTALQDVVAKAQQVLDEGKLDDDATAELADDLSTVQEQSALPDPNKSKVKTVLSRIGRTVAVALSAGASQAITSGAQDAVNHALQLL